MVDPVSGNDEVQGQSTDAWPARLSMVVLSTGDLPAMRHFYRTLGWSEQPGASDTLSSFQLGGVVLTLYPQPAAGAEPNVTATGDRSGITLVINVDAREAVDAAFAAAVQRGAQSVGEPQDQPWGGRSGVVADPEGTRWEILWVPRPR